jgi:hypothetical protein
MSAMYVWREGKRIRDVSGGGYGDMVTDDQIWAHIATSVTKRDLTKIEFAVAVLRLRAVEQAMKVLR